MSRIQLAKIIAEYLRSKGIWARSKSYVVYVKDKSIFEPYELSIFINSNGEKYCFGFFRGPEICFDLNDPGFLDRIVKFIKKNCILA